MFISETDFVGLKYYPEKNKLWNLITNARLNMSNAQRQIWCKSEPCKSVNPQEEGEIQCSRSKHLLLGMPHPSHITWTLIRKSKNMQTSWKKISHHRCHRWLVVVNKVMMTTIKFFERRFQPSTFCISTWARAKKSL